MDQDAWELLLAFLAGGEQAGDQGALGESRRSRVSPRGDPGARRRAAAKAAVSSERSERISRLAASGNDAVAEFPRTLQGEAYAEARRRLESLFLWRGAADPAGLADETLDRVAKKLAEGVEVQRAGQPLAYVLGVARFVLLEASKRRAREQRELERAAKEPEGPSLAERAATEARSAALEHCLDRLGEDQRDLVLRYYRGRGQARIDARAAIAEALKVSARALRLRMHRLRSKLASCIERNVSAATATRGEDTGGDAR